MNTLSGAQYKRQRYHARPIAKPPSTVGALFVAGCVTLGLALGALFFWLAWRDLLWMPLVVYDKAQNVSVGAFVESQAQRVNAVASARMGQSPSISEFIPFSSLTLHMIEGVPSGKQERALNCELQSASDLANYYGVPLTWNDLFMKVGHDPNGDPNLGFVGASFDDMPGQLWPNGYGVYAPAVARGLRSFGLNAVAYASRSPQWLIEQLSKGQPVIVWTTYGMAEARVSGWYTRDGSKWIEGVPYEHTYTVVGYDKEGIFVNDPYGGERRHFRWDEFLRSWAYLGQMSLAIERN